MHVVGWNRGGLDETLVAHLLHPTPQGFAELPYVCYWQLSRSRIKHNLKKMVRTHFFKSQL